MPESNHIQRASDIVKNEAMLGSVLNAFALECHRMSAEKGFCDGPVNIERKIVLIIEEIIEAYGEIREGHDVHEVYYNNDANPPGKPEGFGIELADAVIRLVQLAGELSIPIGNLIVEKLRYNAKRPYKHGKQF